MNNPLLARVRRHVVDLNPAQTHYPPHEILPDLTPYRFFAPTPPDVCVEAPFCAFVLQGEKEVFADQQRQYLHGGQFNLSVIDMPITSRITKASKDEPYYGLVVRLNLDDIGEFIRRHGLSAPKHDNPPKITVIKQVAQLDNVLCRWLDLLDTPSAAPVLAPLYRQEFYFWLLARPESAMLFHATQSDSHAHKISKATEWIRANFRQPISIKALAQSVALSQSGFHHHFARLTGLTPLQFQKQLRLQEARRLMLRGEDAASACIEVGYESTSQFSREYRRCFGNPPKKDIELLQK